MSNDTTFLTPEQLAKRWNMTTGALANWRCKKKGPDFQRIGRRVRYSLSAITTWEQANAVAVNDNQKAGAKSA